jgi:hypothetical protein
MLLAHVASRLNALAASWDQQRERIHTAADVEMPNRYVREKFKEMIHGYPERTPLSPQTVAVHHRDVIGWRTSCSKVCRISGSQGTCISQPIGRRRILA